MKSDSVNRFRRTRNLVLVEIGYFQLCIIVVKWFRCRYQVKVCLQISFNTHKTLKF